MQAKIDQIVSQLKANPNGGYIEIEGHTDNVGDKAINYKLGLERAEAVKRYLYESQQIPLHKINVISYGEEKPIAPNKTEGRPRAEPPRRHQGPGVSTTSFRTPQKGGRIGDGSQETVPESSGVDPSI
jgi:outer membrane protein OmpA-like peptidoglycan-associated protein